MPYEGVQGTPPPLRAERATRPTASAKRASGKLAAREEAANGIGQLVAFGFMISGQLADAGAVGEHWPNISHELAVTAENDAKLAKGLDKLLEVGPYGSLIIAVLPLAGQILANHGVVKPEAMAGIGVVHPESLEADVKASMAMQAADAVHRQRQAEEALRQAQASMSANGVGPEPERAGSEYSDQ